MSVKAEPALVAVSGVKNSGKTTLIAGMLPHLTAAGLRVAVLKHDGHTFSADTPGTDTHRHLEAGACGAAIFDGEKFQLVRRAAVTEADLIPLFPEADLILLEGFKDSPYPKLEVVRAGNSAAPACEIKTLLALVTDLDLSLPGVRRVPLGDFAAAAGVVLDYLWKEEDPCWTGWGGASTTCGYR